MSTRRYTPQDLQNVIDLYNQYLERLDHPWRFANQPHNGKQSLVIVHYPNTNITHVQTGTSRQCDDKIYSAWNQLWKSACRGERIVKILKSESLTQVVTQNEEPKPIHFNKDDASVHTFVKNIMESCGLWSIVYTVDDVQFTQIRKTLV